VVLIARDGKLVYQKAAGFANRECKQRMKLDTESDQLQRASSVEQRDDAQLTARTCTRDGRCSSRSCV
jgi:hypothetical protein